MSALTLFELTGQYRELQALVESDELPAEVIRDTVEALGGQFNDKAIAVAHVIMNLEAASDSIHAASEAMKERAKRVQTRADSLRHYLLYCLQSADVKRLENAELVIKRQSNPPAVYVTDEAAVPDWFWVQPEPPPKRIDKTAVKEALKAGVPVPGAYIESAERLVIAV